MILYNVTIGIDKSVETEWVAWMRQQHIPDVLKSGAFVQHKFYKVLTSDDEATVSYCVQYYTLSIEEFNRYLRDFAPGLIAEHRERFKDKHVAFRTLLEEVE